MTEGYAWAQEMNCAVTVCDKAANAHRALSGDGHDGAEGMRPLPAMGI